MSSTPQAPPPRSIGQADGETQGQGNGLGESPSTLDTPHNTRSHSLPPMARGDEFGETELPAPFDVFGSPSMRSTPDRMQAPSSPSSMSSKSHITQSSSITSDVSVAAVLALTVCPICFLPPLNPHANITPCGHTFCSSCIEKWIDSNLPARPKCPSCRKGFARSALTRNIMVENLLEQVLGIEPNTPPPPPPPNLPVPTYLPPPPRPPASVTAGRAGAVPVSRGQLSELHMRLMSRIRQVGGGSSPGRVDPESSRGALLEAIRQGRRLNVVNRSRTLFNARAENRTRANRAHTTGNRGAQTLLEQIRLGRNRIFESASVTRTSSGGSSQDRLYPPHFAGR